MNLNEGGGNLGNVGSTCVSQPSEVVFLGNSRATPKTVTSVLLYFLLFREKLGFPLHQKHKIQGEVFFCLRGIRPIYSEICGDEQDPTSIST